MISIRSIQPVFKRTFVFLTTWFCLLFGFSLSHASLWVKAPKYAEKGMVVSAHYLASEAGVSILKQGGNAVDAAVATAFALAVVQPFAGNIGGGGFMVIRLADGTVNTIDYREKAPLAAHRTMYLDENGEIIEDLNHTGYLSVGVPGTVAGLTLALEKYGSLPLTTVVQPAIELAENGFPVSYFFSRQMTRYVQVFMKYPVTARYFLKDGERPYQFNEKLVQKDLAQTLRRIAQNGKDGFYRGKTADLIAADMKKNGGLITKEDLAAYEAVIREPTVTTYRDYTVYGMPPPSSGGVTLSLMLNILEGYNLREMGYHSAQHLHVMVEAMRRAYANRAQHLGDPDFNPDIPVAKLLSKEYAAELRATIDLNAATPSDPDNFEWRHHGSETTHFSVIDSAGNVVSNTYTLERLYGSKVVVDGAGFFLNDEMGDFNARPGHTTAGGGIGTEPNVIEPGKRMLSSMTPVIVTRDGEFSFAVGSPGGRTIINTVLQILVNVIDFDMGIYQAVDAPRIHHQWLPDVIRIEKWGVSPDTIELLRQKGHSIDRYDSTQGRAMAVMLDRESGVRMGAADPRGADAAAIGY